MSHGPALVRTTCSSSSGGGAFGPRAGAGHAGAGSSEGLLDPVYPRTHAALMKVAQMVRGHSADRLHLREEQLALALQWRLQLLRGGHHLQPDNDPRLLPGPPLPSLPRAHLYQLAPVGAPALFDRHLAPPDRLHRGCIQECHPQRADRWIVLWVRGHFPVHGKRVDVLQDLVRHSVNRCNCLTTSHRSLLRRPRGPADRGRIGGRRCACAPAATSRWGFPLPSGLLREPLPSSPPPGGERQLPENSVLSLQLFKMFFRCAPGTGHRGPF